MNSWILLLLFQAVDDLEGPPELLLVVVVEEEDPLRLGEAAEAAAEGDLA